MDRVRYSNFFITINPNKRPKSINDLKRMSKILRRVVKDSILSRKGLSEIFGFKQGNLNDIKKIDVEFAIEVGTKSKGGRLHVHIFLKIEHNAMLNVPSRKAIKDIFMHEINLNPAVHIIIAGSERNIYNYLAKTWHL